MNVAFLGLGRMGSELIAHIVAAGHDVTAWNRSPQAVARLAEQGVGVTAADTAAAAVDGAELIVSVLFGPAAVRETVIAGGLPITRGTTWVDVTTVAPADATQFAQWAAPAGIEYVHSPVIGSLGPARSRTLGVLLGGSRAGVEAALPIVSLWADPERLHVYDSPAKAATGKLVANLAIATAMQGLSEALVLGHSGGLSTEEVLERLADKTPLQTIAGLKGELIRTAAFEDAQFSADALAKDAGLMAATAVGPLPSLTAAYASLEAAKAAGFGEHDFSVIARDALR